jgi:hypothetical protein
MTGFIAVWQLRSCYCGAPSLTRAWICLLLNWTQSQSHIATDGRSVLVSSRHLVLMTGYLLLFDSYGLVIVGRPLWREHGSVFCWTELKVKVRVTLRLTVGQSWCRAAIWCSWPDIYCCLTVTVLLLWGALSDERMGLSFVELNSKSKSHCDWRLVSQSVLVSSPHPVLVTGYLLLFDSYSLVIVGRPLWREDGSVFCEGHCLH